MARKTKRSEIGTWLIENIPQSAIESDSRVISQKEWDAHRNLWANPDYRLILEDLVERHIWQEGWLDPSVKRAVPSPEMAMFNEGRKAVVMELLAPIKVLQIKAKKETKRVRQPDPRDE